MAAWESAKADFGPWLPRFQPPGAGFWRPLILGGDADEDGGDVVAAAAVVGAQDQLGHQLVQLARAGEDAAQHAVGEHPGEAVGGQEHQVAGEEGAGVDLLSDGENIDPSGSQVRAVDLDGDGLSEIVVANSGFVAVYRATGGGAFAPRVDYAMAGSSNDLVVAKLEQYDQTGAAPSRSRSSRSRSCSSFPPTRCRRPRRAER